MDKRIQVNLSPNEVNRLERLAEKLGTKTYSATLRYCMNRVAELEDIPISTKKGPKSPRTSFLPR